MPKHIGIAAVSPEGSAFCYRLIGRRASEIARPDHRPLVSLHNRPFSTYVEALNTGDWEAIAQMLADSATSLRDAGADFCVLPDNVAHHALPMAESLSPIPWLSMIDLVAHAIEENGCRTVGLVGTRFVMSGSTYQTALGLKGIRLLVPDEEHMDDIDRIIFREAIFGSAREESQAVVKEAVEDLASRGCDSLILGCSEANIIMGDAARLLPAIDPVELLAEEAINHALRGVSEAVGDTN
ncbi:MAG: aspartate/glutamate racemase family protein [Phycisphaerales bacterium]